ncbi:MAG TPA: LuxR family transcriptional regulator, partial [Clostridia bacterium]|nr:LuxR family transcriptional regulator [Clostridia bacterium]
MNKTKGLKILDARRFSVIGFSFFSVYILSFLFEGRVLYSLLDLHGIDVPGYILASVIAHFIGLL